MICKKRLFILLILVISLQASAKSSKDNDPAKVKKALQGVQTQIQQLEKTVYHSKKEEKSLNKQLAAIDKEIGESAENLQLLQSKMAQHTQSVQRLQEEEKQLQHSTLGQQEALKELLQATFQHYRTEKLQLLLEQHDWSSLARMNQYYQFFYTARAAQINTLQDHLKNVQLLKEKIALEQKQVLTLTDLLKSNQKSLLETKEKRKLILASLSNKLSTVEEQLSELQKQEQHLEQLFKTLQKKLSTTPTYIEPAQDFVKMKNRLILPVEETGAKLAQLPHVKTKNAKKTYIHASTGTPVNAIFGGKVVFAEWLRGLGLLIIIDHGNGYMSLYGNNQKLYKGLGEFVNQGEMIARVGQSGGHAEPGLYFEIRKDGEALDPTPWFKQG
ncbi:MAG: peptidoglycan DD-metalloendopeptidase family protein [Gammaproteobacteria bacterium]|jgi:septal ring factor EnvC (AmiA/AmiB activator)|nr:peptidoglycan DD-metalloendopeptidase family protein [Gammaproteobacteria bacterium]